MAIAGKVAITLSTENGGAWSADVTYDRLVAVKHNNNLYISRKTVANVEPPNNEFWFLALEGFGGDDVQALIDRMNELSDLIQSIINGTTQVGNAKTLDGNSADVFAKAVDLSNYFPNSGGTVSKAGRSPIELRSTNSNNVTSLYSGQDGTLGELGFFGANNPTFRNTSGANNTLLHTGNKPTGTYTGNGDATQRTIATGGIGGILLVYGGGNAGSAIVTPLGAICVKYSDGSVYGLKASEAKYNEGTLTLSTTDGILNSASGTHTYKH